MVCVLRQTQLLLQLPTSGTLRTELQGLERALHDTVLQGVMDRGPHPPTAAHLHSVPPKVCSSMCKICSIDARLVPNGGLVLIDNG